MTARPRLRRHLGVSVVRGEGVYLLCEHGSAVVTDPLAEHLLPLLDGKHDLAAIVTALEQEATPDQVRSAIDQLIRTGQVVEADPDADERTTGYWESLNLHGDTAEQAVRTGVRVTTFGAVGTVELGLDSDDDGFDVVLTDDYLRPELVEFDRRQRAAGRPWLLAKPVGVVAMVGPVFAPDGACYRCLELRMRGHRRAEDYLEHRLSGTRVAPPVADVPATRLLAAGAVATAAAHWLAGHRHAGTHAVLTIDTVTMRSETHPVRRRPQCAGCGDPGIVAATMTRPFRVTSRRKAFSHDGGHRAAHPDEMLRRWSGLVDPITGVVPHLRPTATDLPFLRGYSSGYNRALRVNSLRGLRAGLRTNSSGKGMGDAQAKASALGEALERYCGVHAGDEPTITASYADLGSDAVHPNASMLYSDRQFEHRAVANAKRITFELVADPLDEHLPVEWTPMWSLTRERPRYVPTGLLFYSYPFPGPLYAIADSNGCAAGTSLEDAVLQGFYELVERDSVAIWWYNRLRRPAFDLDSLAEPWIDAMRDEYRKLGRELWALDLTADLGIPAVVAVSRRTDKAAEDVVFGFGAHHDARIAGLRAVGELNQFLPHVAHLTDDEAGYRHLDPNQRDWWLRATVAEHAYLLPDPALPATRAADVTLPTGDDLADDVAACRELVRAKGMDLLVLDETRPDIGLPVVKVMVPGMRHFWTRFAPGRLYGVPVELGWLPAPLTEDQLNPTAMFV